MAHFFKSKNTKPARVRSGISTHKVDTNKKQTQDVEQLKVTRLSDDGRGIASYNSKTIFIENALPNEIVNVTIFNEKSKFYEAFAHTIDKPSNYRRSPRCAHFKYCGGCHLQHLVIEEQRDFKLKNLLDRLRHVSKIIPQNILATITGDEYRYRQRVRLSAASINNKMLLGFRKKNSKSLVDINDCSVMVASLVPVVGCVRDWLNIYKPAVSHIELISGDQKVGLIIRHVLPISVSIRKKLNEMLADSSIICWFQGNKGDVLTSTDGSVCEPKMFYRLDFLLDDTNQQFIYSYHPQDFIQANANVNQKMVNQAVALLQPKADEVYLDLFSGMGNFSLPLSLLAKYVLGIEGSTKMVEQATSNALSNNCNNLSFKQADLFDPQEIEKLVENEEKIDFIDGIILDPPRSGAKIICQNIKILSPNKILYISCDPNTFIRDAQLLTGNNYILEHVGIMDMFAQTYHSEVMGLFVLKSKAYMKRFKRQII